MKYFDVALQNVFTGDKLFSYGYPKDLKVGTVVKVPFGKKTESGIVVGIVKKPTFNVKQIAEISGYCTPTSSLSLMHWMYDFYAEDRGAITSLFLPPDFTFDKESKNFTVPILGNNKLPHKPNIDQAKAIEIISKPQNKKILLHGETGSGKTLVYLQRVIDFIKQGQSVLVLTPEIGLTPQLLELFRAYVKAPVIVNHSDLSNKQRSHIWSFCLNHNGPAVYIGPRSALFLPFHNLGLIVIDESHDNSYKQHQSPKYHAIHVAGQLSKIHNCQIIHSTATPNVDDYYKLQKLGYKTILLPQPAGGAHIHKLNIIDQNNRDDFKHSPYLSDQLVKACQDALSNKGQILLLLNRRGTARLVQCSNCSYVFACPKCGIPLIYHHDKNILLCHSCGYKQKVPTKCPNCESVDLNFSIMGTKSLVGHIEQLFPKATTARFDTDLNLKDKISNKLGDIKAGKIDILIGTQLISKGFDLPNLSVVGVINADNSLNLPDYRAEEISFQQLYQVTGRATRGFKPTQSFIQTKNVNSPVISNLKERSWQNFYNYELDKRQKYYYPPFCYLANIRTRSKQSARAQASCQKIVSQLNGYRLKVLGPSPSFYEKQNGYYVWQIVIKSSKRSTIVEAVKNLKGTFSYDIDPTSLL